MTNRERATKLLAEILGPDMAGVSAVDLVEAELDAVSGNFSQERAADKTDCLIE